MNGFNKDEPTIVVTITITTDTVWIKPTFLDYICKARANAITPKNKIKKLPLTRPEYQHILS